MTIVKVKYILRSLVCLTTITLTSIQASSQMPISQQYPADKLLLAENQYLQGHYALAAQTAAQYKEVVKHSSDLNDKATYIFLASKLKLDDAQSVGPAIDFINTTANPAYKQRVAYGVGQYYFGHSQYANAIPYYELAGIHNLSNAEIADAKFELAYCYFNVRKFDKAEPLLMAIKELKGKYYIAGNYYYGLLTYNQNNYAEALECFTRIAGDEKYRTIVPYYVAEVYYFKGEKGRALEEAKKLLNKPEKLYYDNELHLLVAQILFEQGKYSEALPYFEYYYQHTDRIRKEDLYELAYCYYTGKAWANAIDKFNQLTDNRDSLGQTALYLLGDCFLKINEYKSARNAYSLCADMNYNRSQKEAALLLAAKLSYKMGYNEDALSNVNELLAEFPESKYVDEAKTLLSDLLIKTNNYSEAYNYLQDVKTRDGLYYEVMQRVAYGYAMEQLQNGNLAKADSLLTMSLQRPVNEKYELAANYWKGELAYKMRRFDDVISYSERFISKAGVNKQGEVISSEATIQNAYINMGYAAMELKDFEAAQWYFNKAQLKATDTATAILAVLRQADAVYMQKGYLTAISLYDRVIAANGPEADYAKFQKALAMGVIGKRADKMTLLQTLVNAGPASSYAYDARYEMALVLIEEDKYKDAINVLSPLTSAYEKHNLASKALMKVGFCYQQLDLNEKAIEAYKSIVTDFPASEERSAALDALRSLYVEVNKPDAFAQLLKENNIQVADDNSLDSTYYNAAEVQYATGNWVKAKSALTEYLKRFPAGVFATKAHYYRAAASYQRNEMKDALADYDAVLKNGWSDFAERSALAAAKITMQQSDKSAAMLYYEQLRNYAVSKENIEEAFNGLMVCSYELKKYTEASAYADTLMGLPGVTEPLQVHGQYIKAKALYETGNTEDAYRLFRLLLARKGYTAEANYYMAELQFKNGKLKEAEEIANSVIKQSGGNEKLTLKTYLLLADILIQQKDYFNAKALLQSIVKNAKVDEFKKQASNKLEQVKGLETKQSKLKQD